MEWFCISRAATPSRPLYFQAATFSSFSGTIYRDHTIKQQQTHLRYGSGYQGGPFSSQKMATKKFNMKLYNGGKSHKKVYMIPPTLATISPTNSGMGRPLCQDTMMSRHGCLLCHPGDCGYRASVSPGRSSRGRGEGQLPLVMLVLDLLFVGKMGKNRCSWKQSSCFFLSVSSVFFLIFSMLLYVSDTATLDCVIWKSARSLRCRNHL